MGQPVIIVNHPCSEEIGMQGLAEHLAEKFPQVPGIQKIPSTESAFRRANPGFVRADRKPGRHGFGRFTTSLYHPGGN
jgi:hypothetical protein